MAPADIILTPANLGQSLFQKFIYVEIIYAILIAVLCFAIYFKTKEIYDLTGHKGIALFRSVFLFFALAFLSRLAFVSLRLHFGPTLFRDAFLLSSITLSIGALLSTMALLYLLATVFSKKLIYYSNKSITFVITLAAVILTVPTVILRNQDLLMAIQLGIILASLIYLIFAKEHRENSNKNRLNKSHGFVKRFSKMRLLYISISVFWILNTYMIKVNLRRSWFKILIYLCFVGIFFVMYLIVKKRLSVR